MEKIIEDNEYDPLDDDAFNIAYALYEAGFAALNASEKDSK